MAQQNTTVVVSFVGDASGLAKAIDRVDRELGQLVRQTDRAQAALGSQLGKATARTAANMNVASRRINQYTKEQNLAMKSAGRMRGNMQNLGFQFQDIIVQLEMGTDAMRVFAQQGSQIAGIFGAVGAAVGVAIAGLATLLPLVVDVSGAFDYMGAVLKGVTLPNIKMFIADVKEAWKTSELMWAAASVLGTVLVIKLVPAIVATARALTALAVSNPFTALALAAVTGATFIIANWEKVKLFFDTALPAALSYAESGFYYLKAAAISALNSILSAITDLIQNGLNKLIAGLRSAGETLNIDTLSDLSDISVGQGVITKLSAATEDANRRAREAFEAGAIGWQQYKDALAEINERNDRLIEQELKKKEEIEKTTAAAEKQGEEIKKLYEQLDEDINSKLLSSLDSLIDRFADGELAFKEFATSFLRDIAKMILRASILYAIQSALGMTPVASPNFFGGDGASLFSKILASKDGNAFSNGNVVPFAKGGVVSAPTLFPMSGRTGLMGEAGPEAIMPLERNSRGQLGVAGPNITINNTAGVDIAVTRSDEELIEIAVRRATKQTQQEFSRSMSTGQGVFSRSLEQGYSTKRRAT